MNATIYTTNEYGEYISKKLTFGSSLSGATTIEEAKVVPDTDFFRNRCSDNGVFLL